MTPKERAKDQRLRKLYRWTLEMYNRLGEIQGWRCAACGRSAKNMPLNLDHHHFKIEAHRSEEGNWYAFTRTNGIYVDAIARTKTEAVGVVRERALPLSVRGLLCPGRYAGCNRKLGRIDDPKWLRSVLSYLENPPAKQVFSGE